MYLVTYRVASWSAVSWHSSTGSRTTSELWLLTVFIVVCLCVMFHTDTVKETQRRRTNRERWRKLLIWRKWRTSATNYRRQEHTADHRGLAVNVCFWAAAVAVTASGTCEEVVNCAVCHCWMLLSGFSSNGATHTDSIFMWSPVTSSGSAWELQQWGSRDRTDRHNQQYCNRRG